MPTGAGSGDFDFGPSWSRPSTTRAAASSTFSCGCWTTARSTTRTTDSRRTARSGSRSTVSVTSNPSGWPKCWPNGFAGGSSSFARPARNCGPEPSSAAIQFVAELVVKSAENATAAFVKHMLPAVLEISDAAVADDTPPKRDAVWPLFFKTEYLNGEDACLSELAGALAVLAGTGAPLHDVIADLRHRDTHTANHLLLSLYRGGASLYADEAIAVLCDEQWRFGCGFSDSSNWCAMETIRAVVPHCTMESRARIESVILDYLPPYERSALGYGQFARTRFDLLSAIPSALRSNTANARFDELTRKFGDPAGAPRGMTLATRVESPIAKKATEKMTDEQWLRAITKYPSENRVDHSGDGPKGGARQLAQVLEERVKEDPNRFVHVGLRFPANANPVYLERTLDALKDAAVASDLKLKLCRKAFAVARSFCGRAIADVLGKLEDALPDDAVGILDWLATRDDDPAVERWKREAGGGQPYYNGDMHFHGINTTRGRAVGAIGGPDSQERHVHRAVSYDSRQDGPGSERGRALVCRGNASSRRLPRLFTRHVALPGHGPVRRPSARNAPR